MSVSTSLHQSVNLSALKSKFTLSLCCAALFATPNFADDLESEKLYRLEPTIPLK